MESEITSETVVATDLTLEDALLRRGGQLDQVTFATYANAAMVAAARLNGDAQAKFNVFGPSLVKYCNGYGDPIARRFTFVAYPALKGYDKWEFGGIGQRLEFFQTGSDGFRYVARIYP
jgi:hypothetical protein